MKISKERVYLYITSRTKAREKDLSGGLGRGGGGSFFDNGERLSET